MSKRIRLQIKGKAAFMTVHNLKISSFPVEYLLYRGTLLFLQSHFLIGLYHFKMKFCVNLTDIFNRVTLAECTAVMHVITLTAFTKNLFNVSHK